MTDPNDLQLRYLSASRDSLRRTIARADLLSELAHLDLLAPDSRARLDAIRYALQQPMRLYLYVEDVRPDAFQGEAQCAWSYDRRARTGEAPEFHDFISAHVPIAADLSEGDFVELTLNDSSDADLSLVTLRRTAVGHHPLTDGVREYMRLTGWRIIERTLDA